MITALAFIAGFYLGVLVMSLCNLAAMSDRKQEDFHLEP